MESITQLQKTIKLSQVKIKLHNIKLECDLENDDFEDLIMDFMGWDREDEEEVDINLLQIENINMELRGFHLLIGVMEVYGYLGGIHI